MIIVLVIDSIYASNNGTSISCKRFAEALCQYGHTVRVVTCGDSSKDGLNPETGYEMFYVPELIVPIVSALAHKQKDIWAKPVKSTLERAFKGADVVHIYNPWPLGKASQRVAQAMGVPTLGAFHCQPQNITYNIGLGKVGLAAHLVYYLFNLTFYSRFTHIHCPSKFIAVELRKHGYRQWLHVISNGVHPDFKPGVPYVHQEGEPFKILMVGRLSPEKRQDVLIRAAAMSRHAKDIQLIFAGCGPQDQKLKKMGQSLSHPPIFCFLSKEKLIELMQSCDLYVHASDVEIEGISCLEAISCGLVPVISDSRMSATVQFALNGDNLFQSGKPDSLVEKIDFWLDHPADLQAARIEYARFIPQYSLDRSIRMIESVYDSLAVQSKQENPYLDRWVFRSMSRLFYTGFAIPLLYIGLRVVMGAKIKGAKNFHGLRGALTICNHVHSMDSALVAIATFPRKAVFPTLPTNLNTLWPGKIVRLLGGVALTGKPNELKTFMEEMEYLLRSGRVIHFFPEGELKEYDTQLREFKQGAFHLAARAQAPILPMSIRFEKPVGWRKWVGQKQIMILQIDKPIYPLNMDHKTDAELRQEKARRIMQDLLAKKSS